MSNLVHYLVLASFWAALIAIVVVFAQGERARIRRAREQLVARRLAALSAELNPTYRQARVATSVAFRHTPVA